jgi:hypothetical protein
MRSLALLLLAAPLAHAACEEAEAPRVEMRMNVASATTAPWIVANGWHFLRAPGKTWCYKPPAGGAALAAAEAFAYGVTAEVTPVEADRAELAKIQEFLRKIDRPKLPPVANVGLIDDGSDLTGEVLNLMSRRNILYRIVKQPDPKLPLNLTPKDEADPYLYASEVRRKIGDEKRLLRLYGTEVVIGYLTGDGKRMRLHLLNYARRPVLGLRVRVLGNWRKATLSVFGQEKSEPGEFTHLDGGTEFSVPQMDAYAVADLEK